MRRPRPSLVRRLTGGFFLVHAAALTLLMIVLWPIARMDEDDHVGPSVAMVLLAEDLVIDRRGQLVLRPEADVFAFARSSPRLWFVARGGGREARFGPVPSEVPAMLATSGGIKWAELADVGTTGLAGEASIERRETEAGLLTIAVGGVEPESITFTMWMTYVFREGFIWAPLMLAAVTLLGAIAAIPIVLRSIRPTARAAEELDPQNLAGRIPEAGAVKELLPIVRSFNAALGRVESAFERRRLFIADVAHELRTPLAVLGMRVEELPGGSQKSDLQRSVFRLGQMVGQMLDSERLILSGRRREQVELVELARQAVADVAPLAVASGYEIAFSAACESVTVDGDPHAISRALANLLGNAIAHGGGTGTIEASVSGDGSIDVSDEGEGVPAEARERIFEPFHRERWDRDGCGLGLHLVREIMRSHGGRAYVARAEPGAVLRLEFPAATSSMDAVRQQSRELTHP